MLRIWAITGATLLCLGAVAGCGAGSSEDDGGGSPAARSNLAIVAAFYPLAWATQEIVGDDYAVVDLTAAGGEPHDLELGIQATSALEDADLVVYERGFQPAVDTGVDNVGDAAVVDTATLAAPGPASPHFWLDPVLMSSAVDEIEGELARLVPEEADHFASRADSLREQLAGLDADFSAGLSDCALSTTIVSHDAYGYWERYGLGFAPITATPDAEPTPGDLARLEDLAQEQDLTTIFYEPLQGPDSAEALAADLGLQTAVLDPIEGLTDQTADQDYVALMRANLAALTEANQC